MNKKNQKSITVFIALIAGLILTYFISPDMREADNMQKEIADKIIRFHVRANSDSKEDQDLKLLVKDEVVAYLTEAMKASNSKKDSKAYIEEHLEEITQVAKEVIATQGYDYPVSAYMTSEFFPTKVYGDVTMPCGDYDAFRIDIGENAGHNWWCVLYPPLCFVEGSYGIATDESKTLLKNVLDEDEFQYIYNASRHDIGFSFSFLD